MHQIGGLGLETRQINFRFALRELLEEICQSVSPRLIDNGQHDDHSWIGAAQCRHKTEEEQEVDHAFHEIMAGPDRHIESRRRMMWGMDTPEKSNLACQPMLNPVEKFVDDEAVDPTLDARTD